MPCGVPAEKTRDASDRFLPPIRTTCTRTSRVPGSLSPLARRGIPAETKAPRGIYRGTGRFTTSETASADRHPTLVLEPSINRESRAWACCSHGADAIEPLTPLSRSPVFTLAPLPASRELQAGRAPRLVGLEHGSEDAEAAKTTVDAAS